MAGESCRRRELILLQMEHSGVTLFLAPGLTGTCDKGQSAARAVGQLVFI